MFGKKLVQSRLVMFIVVMAGTTVACSTPKPPSPEPTPTVIPVLPSSISGKLWHDVCEQSGQGEATSPGCVYSERISGYLADGIMEEDEPGIGGVSVRLGEGACPSQGLMEVMTQEDGTFQFMDLLAGTYCVSVGSPGASKLSVEIPGAWTYPLSEQGIGVGSVTVTLPEGEHLSGVNFGWDYFTLPPAPNPTPTSTPTAAPSCTNEVTFVKDVTIPDGYYLQKGELVEKVWRLRNSGTCTWTKDYSLVLVNGESFGAPTIIPLPVEVSPGKEVDLTVDLKAPETNGDYTGYWMLRDAAGALFGIEGRRNEAFWVRVHVGAINQWRGEYFENRWLDGDPYLLRSDRRVNFNWKWSGPVYGMRENNFSARWTRKTSFDEGIYRFHLSGDDGFRLWVDGRLVIDEWKDGAVRERTVDLALKKGNHEVKVEYYERGGVARVWLWREKIKPASFENWRAEYYFDRSLSSKWALVRSEEAIDFEWGKGSPGLGIPKNNFSARWSRLVEFEPGIYRFYASSDDGLRAYVGETMVLNEWHKSSGSETYSAELALSGSQWVRVEYYERKGRAEVAFWWAMVVDLNSSPVAVGDIYAVESGEVLTVAEPGVLGNDVDVDGDALSVILGTGVSHGSLTLATDGSFTYSPLPGFVGTDSFTYQATDGSLSSEPVTVTILVSEAQ